LEKEADEELDTLHTVSVIREHMRILNTQRDSDRLYLERNMQVIHEHILNTQRDSDKLNLERNMQSIFLSPLSLSLPPLPLLSTHILFDLMKIL
jgi:hypothetical protein